MKKAAYIFIILFLSLNLLRKAPFAQQWSVYSTADGLVGNSIWCIQEDRKGYLWFTTAFNGATRYDGLRFENLNTTNGLASNNIYFALADKEGNLWLATDRGVSKFNGGNFQNFDITSGLVGNHVTFILEDSKGNFWFATDRGVSKYDGKDFQNFNDTNGLTDNNVIFVLEDREENLWIGTSKGVNRYDGKKIQPLSAAHLSHPIQVIFQDRSGNLWFGTEGGLYKKSVKKLGIEGPLVEANILTILEDRRGNLWFATYNQGVIKLDVRSKNFVPQKNLAALSVLCMLEDSKANLWFGTNTGISRYNGTSFQNFAEIKGVVLNYVRYALEDSDENIWFGTENGLFKYTMENLRSFTENDGLASNAIHDIIEDTEGSLWLGTDNGVSKYEAGAFQNFSMRDGLIDNDVLSMLQDSEGNLWLGTASGICKNFKPISGEDFPTNTAIRSIMEDRQGNLWFATADGISKYDSRSFQSFPVESGLNMFIDSRDNVWMGSWDTGLYRYDGGESLKHYTMEDGLASNYVTWILETHDGNIWFGLKGGLFQNGSEKTPRGGVCRYDGVSFKNFSTEDGLLSDFIRVALEDREGNLWFGSDKGITKYDSRSSDASSRFQTLTKAHGLISNYVTTILSDRSGNLWFGTNKGVSKYDGENFQNISLEGYFAFGFIETIFEDSRGAMWLITTNDGVIRYIPPAREIRPRIHLSQIEADKIYTGVSKIRVPTTAKRLTFEYKGISFKTKPEQIRYTYKLEGHDPNWHPSTHERRIHYENVSPGDYQFKVRAIDNDLHYSDPPAVVNVRIFQPFYRTVQFFLITSFCAFGLLGGAGYLIVQLKKHRHIAAQFQEKLREQKEAKRIQAAKMESLRQLVAGVAHEVNTPIGAISSSNDVSRRAITKIKEFILSLPKKIKEDRRLTRTLDVLESTNQTSKIASEKIAKIVANLRSFVRLDEAEWQIADIREGIDSVVALMEPEFGNRIKITKEYGDIPKIYCSLSSLNQVFMCIIRNAVEAIEEEGEIKIKTSAKGEYVEIEISDTGKGIPKENLNRIFDPGFTTKGVKVGVGLGLSICYQIINDEYMGRIDVSSSLGEGTLFTITLPQQCGEVTKEPN